MRVRNADEAIVLLVEMKRLLAESRLPFFAVFSAFTSGGQNGFGTKEAEMCRRIYAVVCGVWLVLVIDTGCAQSADHRVLVGESDFAVGQVTVPPDEDRYTVYRRAGLTAFLQADYKQAENSFRDALAEARGFGPSGTRVVTVLGDLAVFDAKTRRF